MAPLRRKFTTAEDSNLVITESAIETLSYHALYRLEKTRYFSIAGEMNAMQRQLLEAAFLKLAPNTVVVMAMNNDAGGKHLAQEIQGLVRATGRGDLTWIEKYPEGAGVDWNDVLMRQASGFCRKWGLGINGTENRCKALNWPFPSQNS